jgi:CDP-diglyceride synthetase
MKDSKNQGCCLILRSQLLSDLCLVLLIAIMLRMVLVKTLGETSESTIKRLNDVKEKELLLQNRFLH